MVTKNLNRIFKTIIRSAVMLLYETWGITNKALEQLRIFERAILRKIFGPMQNNGLFEYK